ERRRAAAGTASRRTGYQKRGSRMTGAPRCGLREKRRERVGGARGGTAARTRKARRGGGHALAFGFAVEEIANGLREAVRARDAAHGAFLSEIGIRLREVEIARTGNNGAAEKRGLERIVPARVVQRAADEDDIGQRVKETHLA